MSKIVLTDAATPSDIALGKTQLYTKSGVGPGTDGLYYKQGSTEVGPLIAGGTVNNLQDAYDGGASIATTVAGGAVSIGSTLAGGPDALAVTVGGSTNATGVLVTNSGPGAAVVATALGTGNSVEVEALNTRALNVKVNGTGSNARGLAVDLTASGSAGTGIEVSVDSTGTGFYLLQAGNGIGIDLISGSTSNEAIRVEATDPASTGNVISSTSNGSGSALYAETKGLGNGVTVYADSGSVGKGIVSFMAGTGAAVYAEKSNAGNGIEVKMISPATGSGLKVESATTLATFPGIAVDHAGEAVGVSVTMTSVGNATGFSAYLDAAGPFAAGMRIELSDPAAAGVGLQVTMPNTATGNAIEVQDTSPATVFAVDSAGNTTTPSVVFGGSRITIEGDAGAAGDPLDPRVTLTSGGTPLGTLKRTYVFRKKTPGPTDFDTLAELPTVIALSNYAASTVNLPSASKYPNGTEILVLNEDAAGSFDVASAAGRSIVNVANTPVTPQTISGGSGRRFMAFDAGSTDVAPVGAWWIVTGTI